MKKTVLFICLGMMFIALTACGKDEADTSDLSSVATGSTVPESNNDNSAVTETDEPDIIEDGSEEAASNPTQHPSAEASPLTQLPSSFPPSFLIEGATIYSMVSTGEAETVVLTSDQKTSTIKDAYLAAIATANLTEVEEATQSIESWGIMGNLNGKSITIAVAPDPTGTAQTAITIKLLK